MWHLKGLFVYMEISLVITRQSDCLRTEILPVFIQWLVHCGCCQRQMQETLRNGQELCGERGKQGRKDSQVLHL